MEKELHENLDTIYKKLIQLSLQDYIINSRSLYEVIFRFPDIRDIEKELVRIEFLTLFKNYEIKDYSLRKCLIKIMRKYAIPLSPPPVDSFEPYRDIHTFQKISELIHFNNPALAIFKRHYLQNLTTDLFHAMMKAFYESSNSLIDENQVKKELDDFVDHKTTERIPLSIGFEFEFSFLSLMFAESTRNTADHAIKANYTRPIQLSTTVEISSDFGSEQESIQVSLFGTRNTCIIQLPNGQMERIEIPAERAHPRYMLNNCEFIVTYRQPQLVSISELEKFIYTKFIEANKDIIKVLKEKFVRAKMQSQEVNFFTDRVLYHPQQRMGLFSKKEKNHMWFTPQCSIGLSVDYLKPVMNEYYRLIGKSNRCYSHSEYVTRFISLFASWDKTLRDYFFFFYYSYLTRHCRKAKLLFLRVKFRQAWYYWIGPQRLEQLKQIVGDSRYIFSSIFRKYFDDVHGMGPCPENVQNTQESTTFPMTEERIIIVELRKFPIKYHNILNID
uniref:Uncharacterized protein n=1 Tax=viral metagenome TaxID=1070528 RepID=A0A6C0K6K9_9ZZZZ